LTSKMIRPDFCQIGVKNDPAGFRPDRTGQILKLAGPDRMQKIRPVPTLIWSHLHLCEIYLSTNVCKTSNILGHYMWICWFVSWQYRRVSSSCVESYNHNESTAHERALSIEVETER
jgi:hypothetical protein